MLLTYVARERTSDLSTSIRRICMKNRVSLVISCTISRTTAFLLSTTLCFSCLQEDHGWNLAPTYCKKLLETKLWNSRSDDTTAGGPCKSHHFLSKSPDTSAFPLEVISEVTENPVCTSTMWRMGLFRISDRNVHLARARALERCTCRCSCA